MTGKLLVAALLATTLAFAQGRGGGRGGRGGEDMSGIVQPRAQRMSQGDMFAEKLKLTIEQRGQADQILRAAMKQSVPLREQLDKSRTDIASALIQGKPEAELKGMFDAHTRLEAQMDAIEADAFARILGTLDADQKKKAGQAFVILAGLFDRPITSGGRGGR